MTTEQESMTMVSPGELRLPPALTRSEVDAVLADPDAHMGPTVRAAEAYSRQLSVTLEGMHPDTAADLEHARLFGSALLGLMLRAEKLTEEEDIRKALGSDDGSTDGLVREALDFRRRLGSRTEALRP